MDQINCVQNSTVTNYNLNNRKLNRRKSNGFNSGLLMFKRRTSLPTIPLKTFNNMNCNNNSNQIILFDNNTNISASLLILKDIQNIIDDLLSNDKLNQLPNDYFINCIKSIRNLITNSKSLNKLNDDNIVCSLNDSSSSSSSSSCTSCGNGSCCSSSNNNNRQSYKKNHFFMNNNEQFKLNNRSDDSNNTLISNENYSSMSVSTSSLSSSSTATTTTTMTNAVCISTTNNTSNINISCNDCTISNSNSTLKLPIKFKNRRTFPSQYRRMSAYSNSSAQIDLGTLRQRSSSLKTSCLFSSNQFDSHQSSGNEDYDDDEGDDDDEFGLEDDNEENDSINDDNDSMDLESKSFDVESSDYDQDFNMCRSANIRKNDSSSATNNPSSISVLYQNKTSDYDSGESQSSSDYNSDTDKLNQLKKDDNNKIAISEKPQQQSILYNYTYNKELQGILEETSNINDLNKDANKNNLLWQPEDLKNLELLNGLHNWNFPIFRFYEKSNKHVLSQMAFKIFDEVGLFKSFDLDVNSFIKYFSALEEGYKELPYHNKIHAADVLHACYYLTTQAVPNFIEIDTSKNTSVLYKERLKLNPHQYALNFSLNNNQPYGCLGSNFTQLELLALYCSAAMHDYEHPGRNNQFLITISSPLAVLYNDKSVLENHHASASWRLLKSSNNFNFLSNLDANEWKRFRSLVLENILSTDLSKHFSIIADFKTKISQSGGIDWTNESDRLIVSEMIIKLADINAPLKEKNLHLQWTERIVEEFYQQGEEESRLGLKISPFMDRNAPQVAKLQENFISILVGSLCNAYNSANLLPGVLLDETEQLEHDSSSPPSPSSDQTLNKKVFFSELLNNYNKNYEMWCDILKQSQQD